MKKLLALLCTLGIAQPAMAASITTLNLLGQAEFRTLSEDLGAALSYKPVTPAAPLGITGFDMGIEVTQTDMSKSSQIWSKSHGRRQLDQQTVCPQTAHRQRAAVRLRYCGVLFQDTEHQYFALWRRTALRDSRWRPCATRNRRPRFLYQVERRQPAVAGYQRTGYLHLQRLRHVHSLCRRRSGVGQQHGKCRQSCR